jgi:hypothetical protein
MDEQRATNADLRGTRGAGGTPGGLREFFLGLAFAAAGGYLLTNQVMVTSGYWQLWGYSAFGLSLLPLVIGIGVLFFNGRSVLGWVLTVGGTAIILVGVLTHLQIFFRPTSLFNTLLMLALLASGLGLIARSLKAQ